MWHVLGQTLFWTKTVTAYYKLWCHSWSQLINQLGSRMTRPTSCKLDKCSKSLDTKILIFIFRNSLKILFLVLCSVLFLFLNFDSLKLDSNIHLYKQSCFLFFRCFVLFHELWWSPNWEKAFYKCFASFANVSHNTCTRQR